MMKVKPLTRKEVRGILEKVHTTFGCTTTLIDEYYFFISDKNKVYIVTTMLTDLPLDAVRINSLGLYFCEINREEIRLSIEGSMIIGPNATKNVVELDAALAKDWLLGNDISWDKQFNSFAIIKHGTDFLGSGKWKENRILNYVPKQRRIRE